MTSVGQDLFGNIVNHLTTPDPCAGQGGDSDGDGICDGGTSPDNCPSVPNPGQENSDTDAFGDACDNCDLVDNPGQEDSDVDQAGSPDPDGVGDACDNCDFANNPDQDNIDGDPFGDECDICPNDASNTCIRELGVKPQAPTLPAKKIWVDLSFTIEEPSTIPLHLFAPECCNTRVKASFNPDLSNPLRPVDCFGIYGFGPQPRGDQIKLDPNYDRSGDGTYDTIRYSKTFKCEATKHFILEPDQALHP
jgi:hypothetical protein